MPGLKSINDFKSRLNGGGARPNLFEVQFPAFPDALTASWSGELQKEFKFLCKTAALPASNVAAIEVPFRGKTLKVAGDRTLDVWTVTVINDEDFGLRTAFEDWMRYINAHETARGPSDPADYQKDATVYQLGRTVAGGGAEDGESEASNYLKAYSFFGIFPTNISQIDLSYDSTDTIEEFTVEFQVQYWQPGEIATEDE